MSVSGIIILVLVILFIFIFNGLILKRHSVDNALAILNAFLKKRCDLVSALVAETKDHLPAEGEKLSAMAAQRTKITDLSEKCQWDIDFSSELKKFLEQLKTVPELQDSKSISDFQDDFQEIEKNLPDVRNNYNQAVTVYNKAIKTVPGSFFAPLMNLKIRKHFTLTTEESK